MSVTKNREMSIGKVAKLTGLTTKTIRYYDAIGLVVSRRESNGYRLYYQAQVDQLKLIARGRLLGFSIDECRELLSIAAKRDDGHCSERELNLMVNARLRDVEEKIDALTDIKKQVEHFADAERCI
jgi:MerR family copper efflux transcriptional regulator